MQPALYTVLPVTGAPYAAHLDDETEMRLSATATMTRIELACHQDRSLLLVADKRPIDPALPLNEHAPWIQGDAFLVAIDGWGVVSLAMVVALDILYAYNAWRDVHYSRLFRSPARSRYLHDMALRALSRSAILLCVDCQYAAESETCHDPCQGALDGAQQRDTAV